MCMGLPLGYLRVWSLPVDAIQGLVFKIMYVHVPAAWLSLFLYALLALSGLSYLIWRHWVSFFMAQACAWIGALFTLVCLITGMFWGKPTWGAWWVWDARLTSVALLFFLYVGYLFLTHAFDTHERAAHNGSLLAILGAINLPIIKWSVNWWHTLHQPASITKFAAPSIAGSFLWPLMVCAVGWFGYALCSVCLLTWHYLNVHKKRNRSGEHG